MKIDANDPRWTAYALGEIKDAGERAELEKILQESEEIRRMVQEIRRTADLLNDSLKSESPVFLTKAQRNRIESGVTNKRAWFFFRPVWALSGVAALLLLILSVWMHELKTDQTVSGTLTADLRTEDAVTKSESTGVEPSEMDVKKRAPAPRTAPAAVPPAETPGVSATVPENTTRGGPGSDASISKGKVPNVELATTSIIVEGKPVEPDTAPVPAAEQTPESQLPLPAAEVPDALALAQAAKSTGEGASISGNEAWEADQTKLAGISADQVDVQSDGVISKEIRHQEGIPSPVKLNPEQVGEIKLVIEPVDAEMGRASGQMQAVTGSGFVSGLARGRGPFPVPPPPPLPRRPDERRMPPLQGDGPNTESYDFVVDNPFLETEQNPLSTFSIDVDTASYSNVRRFLEGTSLPPKDAVRIEELVNYFDYDYRGPDDEHPFAARFEMAEAPWNPEHKLLRIGLKALEMDAKERPASNLVFLIDVSGSMGDRNKLPLVQDSLRILVDQLTASDHVAIVTYAGTTRVLLSSTAGDEKWKIHRAIDSLRSGGSTAGASGIRLAYETAQRNFIKGGANRVILATDGDFNVGITSRGDLTRLIEEKAESGVFLSALGYGMGNYKDDTLELLADKGRGNYAYIDTIQEAKKVLAEKINATLISVARDVKIQVEFNPAHVGAYRLIGYENRVMPKEDFNDDAKKAGVIGAGHAVTALYEIIPPGKPVPVSGVDPLKYQKPLETTRAASGDEVGTVKIRYKDPEGETSRLLEFPVKDSDGKFSRASRDFRFAASVAAFGMVLRDSPYKGGATLEDALSWAKDGKGPDRYGYREEFIRLIHRAISIKK